MRPALTALLLSAAVTLPAAAQDTPAPDGNPELSEGFSLLSEGARMILRGLQSEMAPMIEALGDVIEDVNAYELPERLPNGDILIRRKADRPWPPEGADEGEGEAIDL